MSKPNVREQLLNAGLESLHRRGFNATSVQDITQAAGVPKGSFYNHFESKEALGLAVVAAYVEKTDARLETFNDTSVAPLVRLRSYFEGLIEWSVKDQFACGCLLGNFSAELSSQSPVIRTEIGGMLRSWSESVAKLLDEARGDARLRNHLKSVELASYIIDSWEGAVLRARVEQSRAPLDAFLKITFERLLA